MIWRAEPTCEPECSLFLSDHIDVHIMSEVYYSQVCDVAPLVDLSTQLSKVNMTGVDMRGGGVPGQGLGLGLPIDACTESDGRHSGGEDMGDDDYSDSGLLRCPRCDFDTHSRIIFVAHLTECNGDNGGDGLGGESGDNSPDRINRKFECDVCNMKFSNGANMRRHKMRHTGVKPYECRVCQKRFFRKDHLAEHFTTHTKTLPYHCPICNRGFQRQIAMRAHFQNEHVGQHDMVKSCPLCAYQAATMKSLRVHFYNRHGIDLDNPGPSLGVEPIANSTSAVNGGPGATLGSALVVSPSEPGESTPPMHFLTPHIEISMADPPNAYSPGQSEHANGSCDMNGDPSSPQSVDSTSFSVNASSMTNVALVRRESPDLGFNGITVNGCSGKASPPMSLLPVKQEALCDVLMGTASSGSGSGEEGEEEKKCPNGPVNLTTNRALGEVPSSATRLIKVSPLKSLLRDDGKRTRQVPSRPHPELLPVSRPTVNGPSPDPGQANNVLSCEMSSKLQCNFCGIAFPDQTLYFLHKGCHSDTNPWKCNICGEQCSSVYDFNAHLLSKPHQ